jgi:hypothetical protein
MAGQSIVTKDGYMYFFCETTGDGFKIGDLGGTTKEAVEDIIFLNYYEAIRIHSGCTARIRVVSFCSCDDI